MSGPSSEGAAALRRLVLGKDLDPDRLAFFCEATGLEAARLDPAGNADPAPAGREDLLLAEAVMACYGHLPASMVRQRLGSLKVMAASRIRAEAASLPGLRRATGEVTVQAVQTAHAGFFALDVLSLTHRRFDGSTSPSLRREVFLAGDAVTVLPYDPVRDRVLVIEQLRIGPLGRGDPLPWQIEAIAGRIDPGESPTDAARREAIEEAGLTLGRLEKVAEYYPTPGAVSEYLYSFVALCDLPDSAAGHFGAEEEAEDIRGQLLSHAELMAALARGEIGNAPLILTALWLNRERDRLRQGQG